MACGRRVQGTTELTRCYEQNRRIYDKEQNIPVLNSADLQKLDNIGGQVSLSVTVGEIAKLQYSSNKQLVTHLYERP